MSDFVLSTQEPSETERLHRPKQVRRTLVWRCSDCGCLYRQPSDMPLDPEWMEAIMGAQREIDGGESHGLCPECLPKWEARIKAGQSFEAAAIVNGNTR